MKKRKWAAALMSMALATAMISGCSVIKEEISHSIYQPQINPLAGQNISETITSNFYYVVEGENQLASVSQTIDVASGETREEAVLRTLLQGPPQNMGLASALPEGTEVVSVSLDGQTLNVTMNNRFLTSTPVVMSDGTVSESAAEQTAMKNRLALYAVVNSLAELDPFIQLQILVDKDKTGKGTRPTRLEVGLTGTGENSVLEPLGKNNDLLLTPKTAVEIVMDGAMSNDKQRASRLLSGSFDLTNAEALQAKAEQARGAVDSYQIVDVSMAEDGQSAVVYVDVTQTMKDGQSQKLYNQAISVKRDTGIWKVEVESIEPILFP